LEITKAERTFSKPVGQGHFKIKSFKRKPIADEINTKAIDKETLSFAYNSKGTDT